MSTETDATEIIINKPMTTTLTGVKSQPIQFISNKKMTTNNTLATTSDAKSIEHNASSLIEQNFSAGSYGQQYVSTSAGKTTTVLEPKSTGLHLSEINGFSNNRVSAFLPLDEIIINDQAGAKNEIVSRIFAEVREVQEGKVDNLLRIMSFHPEFLQEFINLYNYLMYSQHGALPYDSRHFIAIMAASRHKCIYLVKQQEREFLNQNGQKKWLQHGINYIPQKLKDLYELNKLLCHQPWLINHTHVEKILKGPYSWTVTELTMAITILTLFHSLSGFVFGCGINENYTQELRRQYEREEEEIARRKQRAARVAAAMAASSKSSKSGSKSSRSKRGRRDRSGGGSNDVLKSYEELSDNELATRGDNDSDDDEDEHEDEADDEPDSDDELECERDNDDNDENLDMAGGDFLADGGASAARLHARTSRASNFRNSSGSSSDMGGGFRARSSSTGASNRTLSNSSASSCEVGIDLLLKEMQMINQKSEDKQNQHKSIMSTSVSSTSSSILSCSASVTSSYIMQKIMRSTSPNGCSGYCPMPPVSSATACFSPPTTTGNPIMPSIPAAVASNTNVSSSGPSTITNNSPTTNLNGNAVASSANNICYNYLSDLSNTTSLNGSTNGCVNGGAAAATSSSVGRTNHHFIHQAHDKNNNSIHHSHIYHHNNHHHHNTNNITQNQYHQTASKKSENGSDVEAEKSEMVTTSTNGKATRTTNSVKFDGVSVVMMSAGKSLDDEHQLHAHMNQQQQQQQQEPVSHSVINQKIREYMLKYAFDPDYGYQDFETSADHSLGLEYYTWENQGYITVASFYPDICEFLDKNFQVAANMTYNTMGSVKGVDTSLFRKAVWFYTHSLFGVKYDDYDYSQIRILLKSPLRKYIKTVCTQPDRISKVQYDSIMKEFTHSEKVHMNLVIMEARIQASMLYFLRAVNSYFG